MIITSQNQNTTTKLPNTASPVTKSATPAGAAAASKACAACKHQRRRCAPHCPLAPYFPADKQHEFLNVHKLFGVNNVLKILKKTPQHERQTAMKTVVFEANMRAANPVGGCHGLILDLQNKINTCMSELDIVLKHLALYKPKLDVYDDQLQEPISVGRCSNQECLKIDTVRQFSENQEHEESSSRLTDCRNQAGKIETLQQFLNDKPTEWRESNESRGNEVLKDDA